MKIKKIISIDDWGMSPFIEKSFFYKDNKTPVKYNFWDILDGFNKVLFYENDRYKHTWMIKICPIVNNQDIPNWFITWWRFFGAKPEILPEPFKGYFEEWERISPRNYKNSMISFMFFIIEFSIPYIWKWSVTVTDKDYIITERDSIPVLMRESSSRFWEKMLKEDPATRELHGHDTIQKIETSLVHYRHHQTEQNKGTESVTGKSKEQVIKEYLDNLEKTLRDMEDDKSQGSDQTMTSASSNQYHILANTQEIDNDQDAQGPLSPPPIRDILAEARELLLERVKGKGIQE